LELFGVEPSSALIQQAVASGIPAGIIREAPGQALPFADDAVDVVTAFGVLHHVSDPSVVIQEMARVARRAIFISDSNRFAQGRPFARFAKVAIAAVRLWRAFDYIRTRGKRYMVSEGDGVFYSYSVFDSLRQLRDFAPELVIVELETARDLAGPWRGPMCNAPTLLVGAIRRD
jgi:SAM-dependent methyltransferase